MTYTQQYLEKCEGLIQVVAEQEEKIQAVARIFSLSVLS